jgi:hypothetical protein
VRVIDVEKFMFPMSPMRPSGKVGVLVHNRKVVEIIRQAQSAGTLVYLRISRPVSAPTPAPAPPVRSVLGDKPCLQTIPGTISLDTPSAVGKLTSHSNAPVTNPASSTCETVPSMETELTVVG